MTIKLCDCSQKQSSEPLHPECHDANLVFCQLCAVAGSGGTTQDWICKDCIDQAIVGFDDYKLV